jgi:alkylglycerol monooxygenase
MAIPAFFLFFGLEFVIARKRQKNLFNFESSISNIITGIAERLLNLFLTAGFYGVFEWIYDHCSLWHVPNTWHVWVILIFITDLIWYWYHRLGHEVNIMWAAHVVHHQSEDYNYTVSARITTLQALARNIFWCVLPLIGFHPAMVFTILIVHGTYSFFTHTQVIGTLGWLENFLVTPSHHRVHHASNHKYLNKNYGDIFIFWDKLFGTFQREEETPVYGLTHPLKSFSFIWQHFHYFIELFYVASKTSGVIGKLKIVFGKPEMLDAEIRTSLERKLIPVASTVKTSSRFKIYLVSQVTVVSLILFIVTLFYKDTHILDRISASVFILITLINCGALLQQRRWIYYLEYVRLFILTSYLSFVMDSPSAWVVTTSIMIVLVSGSSLLRRHYLNFFYGE